ncbi:MAG: alpha/beta hydrolase [Chitinophagaceae bacterium]
MRYLIIFLITLACKCIAFAQEATPSYGQVIRHAQFPSKFVKSRNIDVWLPIGYNPQKKYAVLYMHDGQNLFDTTITFNHQEWGVDEALSQLQVSKKIKDCIVVGIWNTTLRRQEYYPKKVFDMVPDIWKDSLRKDLGNPQAIPLGDDYLKFMVTELKPFIDHTYPTLTDKSNTYVAGSSMGGLISMYAMCEYPQVFGGAACLSTHWTGSVFRNEPAIAKGFMQYLEKYLPKPNQHIWYFDYGTATLDAWYEPYQLQANEIFKKKGYNNKHYRCRKFEGAAHNEAAWQARLPEIFAYLLAK